MNINQARQNMISQQVRTANVSDQSILEVFANTPREIFVPTEYKNLAYADMQIPLEHGQKMMEPMFEAKMLQALEIAPTESILEIGTGTGYITSLLAKLGHSVHSVDIFEDFIQAAELKLKNLELTNVSLQCGDAAKGWSQSAPYDIIVITARTPLLAESYLNDLTIGGRLFVIIGDSRCANATVFTREAKNDWSRKSLFEIDLPELINAPQPEPFQF